LVQVQYRPLREAVNSLALSQNVPIKIDSQLSQIPDLDDLCRLLLFSPRHRATSDEHCSALRFAVQFQLGCLTHVITSLNRIITKPTL
jgi:hypothetical protein